MKDETVDLVYLDPPFNSNQDYNVLFAEQPGKRSAAQIRAFEDTWTWDVGAEAAYVEVVEGGGKVADALRAFRTFLGESDMMAYLAMMAPRLVELRHVLKPTGSIYLHCDPTASHYLKMLLDGIFDPRRFRSEIVWKRSSAHSDTKQGRRQHGRIHDILFFYTRGDSWGWTPVYTPYDPEYVEQFYRHVEEGTGRRYRLGDLTGPGGAAKGNPRYEVMGVTRYWRYTEQKMRELIRLGRVVQTRPGTVPQYKRYLDEMPGVPLQDVWTDLKPIGAQAAERLGYPTQKPESLLERIVRAGSEEGATVLDPFCGCGTAIAVAQRLGRRWVGVDITHLAVGLIKHRLQDAHGLVAGKDYQVVGEPADLAGAARLAGEDPYQFQCWSLGLVGARSADIKKGADRGVDGRLYFHDEKGSAKTKEIVFSVKGGHTGAGDVRDLRGVVEREGAAIGVLISLQEPTAPMRAEAAKAGFYESPTYRKKYPRLQPLSIANLLDGRRIEYPPSRYVDVPMHKPAPRATMAETRPLPFGKEEE
ncbi:MAG: restriction endonuclease [Planctomycetales bacterium]|nr:restriction endonuclease [Planctomycetales bacterium]